MKEDVSPARFIVREWVALTPTFLKASDIPAAALDAADLLAVPAGARLKASVALQALGHSWLRDPRLDGLAVPPHLSVLLNEDWKLLPMQPLRDNAKTELSAEKLASVRWSFGDLGIHPWSKSFYFEPGGTISGVTGPNHRFWRLEDGVLTLYGNDRRPSWSSQTIVLRNGRLVVTGQGVVEPARPKTVVLTELAPRVTQLADPRDQAPDHRASGLPPEAVRLVIWDLDDTFWNGTLAEGGITPIPAHIEIVRQLSARGIVNSICSKNEFARTKAELERLGVWDQFIFPRIDFVPKGAMIKEIIEAAQLRTPSVLFIDDNMININEALHYNPGLQVCLPDAIAGLLTDPRCKGKPDSEMKRLANYKVLETKWLDQAAAGKDNLEFLRQSDIRISFHHDIMAEFPRIHDLVNRSNQLNFTKRRWPEDIEAAKAAFHADMDQEFNSHCGYVKVSDRYGNYGIVGFYMTRQTTCPHFLFSCRTLNMGIEQFVWQRLGQPYVNIIGEVVAKLGSNPDWITVVDDADAATGAIVASGPRPLICLRGACDLSMMTHYLRANFDTIEEFPFPYNHWAIFPVARAVVLHDELNTDESQALLAKLPGMPADRFVSGVNTGVADIYILSFSPEVFPSYHRSRTTGLILPLATDFVKQANFSSVAYETIAEKAGPAGTSAEHWAFLQSEFEYLGNLDYEMLARDVDVILQKLLGKQVIVFLFNERVGNDNWLLQTFGKINATVLPLARKYGCQVLDLNDFVRDIPDLVEPDSNGAHFRRDIYRQVAERVKEMVALNTVRKPELVTA